MFSFTIHYGEIKTQAQAHPILASRHLQSTMVRLRPRAAMTFALTSLYLDLQSTMVRLRRC